MILVTGGAGFIGSNFIQDWFLHSNERIVTVDKLTYAGNLGNLENLKNNEKFKFVKADISDKKTLRRLLVEEKPRAIINFAAESHVDRSISSPRSFFTTNVIGTLELLETCKDYWESLIEEKKEEFIFLHISTDEVYGDLEEDEDGFVEESRFKPNSPYAASKASSDHIIRSYFQTYNFPVITTNCSNNFGPYQYPEKLIPLTILNLFTGKKVPIYGDGNQIRDWLYVLDHCEALRIILKNGKKGEVYNIGSNNEIKNIDLVKLIFRKIQKVSTEQNIELFDNQIDFIEDRPGHDRRYSINPKKIRQELSWKPSHTFDSALEKTVVWYLDNKEWLKNVSNVDYQEWILKQYS
jgi:dTDP-glucose 4,6-dehydratase